MLEKIEQALMKIDSNVFYGAVGRDKIKDKPWDYIVFGRDSMRRNSNNTGYADYYVVVIVRESYIEEGLAEKIINEMTKINGVRLVNDSMDYSYTRKNDTDLVVESLAISFVCPRKRD